VKPGNVFLAQTGQDELQVRVVDFGIAKLADDEDTSNSLTQDGRAPHSPAFASPEQLRGLSHLSPASDVFSLGAVGFQLLTGDRPFSEADRNRMSLGMPVPAPSLRSRNPAIPIAVEAIVQRALAFDPEERFADAGEMATALDQVLRELPDRPLDGYPSVSLPPLAPIAEPEAPDTDRTEFMQDDRTLLAPDTAEPERPVPPPTPAPEKAAKPTPPEPPRRRTALWVWIFGLLALAAAVAWVVLQGPGVRRLATPTEEAPGTLSIVPADSALPDTAATQPGLDAFVHNQEGVRLYNAGQSQAALQQFSQAVQLQPDSAGYRRNLALSLLQLGRPAEAERQLDAALRIAPGLALIHANLAQAQLAQADTGAAISSLERFTDLSPPGRARQIAETQLRELKAARAGLLGVPILPDSASRDTALQPIR
jgi:tetratricopeptide (TPR) repeat protein